MKLRDKLILLCIPALMAAGGMIALGMICDATLDTLLLLIIIAAALINSIPFVFLFVIHFRRVRNKTGPRNYSLWVAYMPAVLVMLVVILIVLREVSFGRPGTQFAGVTIFFLPNLTIPVIVVGYIIGWVIEWFLRRRGDVYKAEDTLGWQALFGYLTKHKKTIYTIVLAIIAASIFLSLLLPLGHELLLSSGIIPWYGIHEAAEFGHIRSVKRFLNKGVDINAQNEDGATPLHLAMFACKKDIIEFLIANGANVDARNKRGATPLHNAAWTGYTASVNSLIKHGADVNAKDNHGDTPLHEAVSKGRMSTVKILLANGADINVRNNMNQTPLWDAVYWGYKDLTKLLIEQGAEVNVADKKDRTPLSIAIEEKYRGIEKLLRQHGAKE